MYKDRDFGSIVKPRTWEKERQSKGRRILELLKETARQTTLTVAAAREYEKKVRRVATTYDILILELSDADIQMIRIRGGKKRF